MNEPDDIEPIDFSTTFEHRDELIKAARAAGIPKELADSLNSELEETEEEDTRVIFVSSDGDVVYKAI
jgi:hypothetical protein